MLKVPQSALDNWPVLTMEAVGILITRALVEVVMLKMLPKVPVETFWMMLLTVIAVLLWRFLEASVVTRELAVKVAMLMLPKAVTLNMEELVEEAISNKG